MASAAETRPATRTDQITRSINKLDSLFVGNERGRRRINDEATGKMKHGIARTFKGDDENQIVLDVLNLEEKAATIRNVFRNKVERHIEELLAEKRAIERAYGAKKMVEKEGYKELSEKITAQAEILDTPVSASHTPNYLRRIKERAVREYIASQQRI